MKKKRYPREEGPEESLLREDVDRTSDISIKSPVISPSVNSTEADKVLENNNSIISPSESEENLRKARHIERRRSTWAPAATSTRFADVPVYTVCPYCSQKIVTKTHFRRGRKNWYCCFWLPYVLDIFKDVIHTCPKCSNQIAIYNRFYIFRRNICIDESKK